MPAGIGNVAGNKGGVGVALTYMDHTRLLFVNAHFQAHTHRVAGRQADYLRIKAGLFNNREEAGQYLLYTLFMPRICCAKLEDVDVLLTAYMLVSEWKSTGCSCPGNVVQSSRISLSSLFHGCLSRNERTNSGMPGYQYL